MKVAPSQIEEQLDQLWTREQGPEGVRAALFNLVLHVRDRARADYVRGIINEVREKFPCRIITLLEGEESSIEVSLETIDIQYQSTEIEQVPYLVLPHLLPDMPVYFYWAGDPSREDPIFPTLQPYVTRLIYDPDNLEQIPEFEKILGSKRFHGDLADLKWAHLDGWRLVLASVFNTPDRFGAIARARNVEIVYSKRETLFPRDPAMHASYLVAWLAARLGWKHLSPGLYQLADGRQVETSLRAEEEPALPFGSILSIEIISHEEEHTRFSLSDGYVQVSSDSPEKCGIPYTLYLPKATRSGSLVSEIFRRGTSRHYQDMLQQL